MPGNQQPARMSDRLPSDRSFFEDVGFARRRDKRRKQRHPAKASRKKNRS